MPVALHVWRVAPSRVPAAMLRIGLTRMRVPGGLARGAAGVRFVKFVGTSVGISFGLGDADLTRWAALTVSDEPVSFPGWDRLARSSVRVDLEPLSSRGRWSRTEPFRHFSKYGGGMVLALTRARLRPTRAAVFWRAIPPVAAELAAAPGLLARFGIGEAPIGWQGTVSLWRDATDLTRFAYRQPEHRAVIERTPVDRWYAEELFARFAVLGIDGDRDVLGWLEEGQAKR